MSARVRSAAALLALSLAVALLAVTPGPARAGEIRGFVRDEQGNPVFNADFNVYEADTGIKLAPSDKTDRTGKYRLLVDPGRYELLCRPVVGTGLAARVARDVVVSGIVNMDWTLPAGTQARGRVTDSTNPDANSNGVYPCNLDYDRTADGIRQPVQGNITSPFGTFITYIEGGSYSVTAQPEDTLLAPARVFNWVLPTTEILQLPLVPAMRMAGTIRDVNGAAVPGVELKFDIPNIGRQPASKHLTDANGFYRLGIAPGTYRITVEPPLSGHYAAIRIPDVDVTAPLLQDYTLPFGAAVTGLVSDKNGRPVGAARWSVLDEQTGVIAATPNAVSAFDGSYRLVLVPGVYRLRLTPAASTGLDSVVYEHVAINSDMTLDVDYAVLAAGPEGNSPVIRFAPRGNPSHTTAAVSLVLRTPIASALLEIYDVAGRRVRTLYSGALGLGTHNVPWDGRHDNGARAHTGVYLVRARLDGHEQVTRFVLLP